MAAKHKKVASFLVSNQGNEIRLATMEEPDNIKC